MNDLEARFVETLATIDSKISALEERFAPVAEAASRNIDQRLQIGILPILRCLDAVIAFRRESSLEAQATFEVLEYELDSILESLNIERFSLDTFDNLKHRIVGVCPTNIEELDGTIAQCVSDGYALGPRVIRAQQVLLYKYQGIN